MPLTLPAEYCRRYLTFLRSPAGQEAPRYYGLWVRLHLTRFGAENGFHADLSFCRGVAVRTQSEANNVALLRLGQEAFDDWLEALYPFPPETP